MMPVWGRLVKWVAATVSSSMFFATALESLSPDSLCSAMFQVPFFIKDAESG